MIRRTSWVFTGTLPKYTLYKIKRMPTNSEIKMLFEQIAKAAIEDDRRSSIDHLKFALLHAQTAENFTRRYNTSVKYDSVYVCIRQIIAILEGDVQAPSENE